MTRRGAGLASPREQGGRVRAAGARAAGRLAGAVAVIALLTLLTVPLAVRVGAALEAVGFLGEFLGAGRAPWLAGREGPELATRGLASGGVADLWRPRALEPHRGLILVHGLTPRGKDDPRIQAAAQQLGRAGFAVIVPDLPALRAQRLRPEDAVLVREAVDTLAREPGVVSRHLALVAVSVGLGPVMLALTEPTPDRRVTTLASLGGHAEARELIRYFTTGIYRFGPRGGQSPVDPELVAGFLRLNLDIVQDPRDRAAVRAALEGGPGGPRPPPLGEEGRAVLALLANRDPARVDPLLAALPAETNGLLDALSPARHVARFPGRLILVHGRDDPAVPFTEAERLLAAADPARARLAIVGLLGHVEGLAGGAARARDALRLLTLTYALFRS